MSDLEFDVREALGRSGEEVVIFQIDLEKVFEINVWMEKSKLTEFREFLIKQESYLYAGTSANSPAIWEYMDGELCLMVGEDRELWDIAILIDGDDRQKLLNAFNG